MKEIILKARNLFQAKIATEEQAYAALTIGTFLFALIAGSILYFLYNIGLISDTGVFIVGVVAVITWGASWFGMLVHIDYTFISIRGGENDTEMPGFWLLILVGFAAFPVFSYFTYLDTKRIFKVQRKRR